MQRFDIKRGHYAKIEDDRLEALMEEVFGNVTQKGGKLLSRYNALDPITVWVEDKTTLGVEITTRRDVSDEEALSSIRARNAFLESATGFNAKQRSKRMKKKAKEGKL